MALVSSAISRAFLPLPASLGRPTWPSPCPFLKAALAFLRSKLPSPFTSVSDFFCQTHIICAAFSSSVMRDNRSLARRHPILSSLGSLAEMAEEIAGSRRHIESQLDRPVPH